MIKLSSSSVIGMTRLGIVSLALLAYSCTNSDEAKSHIIEKQLAAHYFVNASWLNRVHGLLMADQLKEDVGTQELVGRVILQQAALMATFQYLDYEVQCKVYFESVRKLRKHGLISENDLADPFGLRDFFEKHPQKEWGIGNVPVEVVRNRDTYEQFTVWFRKVIEKPSMKK